MFCLGDSNSRVVAYTIICATAYYRAAAANNALSGVCKSQVWSLDSEASLLTTTCESISKALD